MEEGGHSCRLLSLKDESVPPRDVLGVLSGTGANRA
jgi:hypothetical protein